MSGPRQFNRKGHFEDNRIVQLHSNAIKKELPKSKGWVVSKNINLTFDQVERLELKALLKSYETKFDLWGWKDPRAVLFLKCWKEIVPDLKVLMVWRSIDEVIASLIKRSILSESKNTKINLFDAIKTWQVYNEKIIEFHRAFPEDSMVVPLQEIIDGQDELLSQISKKFGFSLELNCIQGVYEEQLLSSRKKSYLVLLPKVRKISQELNDISFGINCRTQY